MYRTETATGQRRRRANGGRNGSDIWKAEETVRLIIALDTPLKISANGWMYEGPGRKHRKQHRIAGQPKTCVCVCARWRVARWVWDFGIVFPLPPDLLRNRGQSLSRRRSTNARHADELFFATFMRSRKRLRNECNERGRGRWSKGCCCHNFV